MATSTRTSPASTVVRIDDVLRQLVAGLRDAFALTTHQQAVAHLVLFGCNSFAIAARLDHSEADILACIRDLFARTRTCSREELMRVALRIAGQREAADVPLGAEAQAAPTPAIVTPPSYRTRVRPRHAQAWPVAVASLAPVQDRN